MISPMSRFEVVGPRDLLWQTLDAIQDVGACHLDPAPLSAEDVEGSLSRPPLAAEDAGFRGECGELAARYEARVSGLPAAVFRDEDEIAAHTDSFEHRDRGEMLGLARARLAEWDRLRARVDNLREDQALFKRYQKILSGLDSLRVHSNATVIPLLLDGGYADPGELVERIREICAGSRTPVESKTQRLDGGAELLALAVPAEHEVEVRELLWEEKLSEVVFPQEYADLKPMAIRNRIEERLREIPQEIEDVEAQLDAHLADFGVELVALRNYLTDSAARLDAYQKAAVSDYAFMLAGWVPFQKKAEVRDELARVGDGVLEFQVVGAGHESPPTHLTNPGFASPFESLLGIFPPAKSDAIDPTLFMTFTFPLFFGFMVGDAGYGFCMLLLALWARVSFGSKYPVIKDVSYVMGLAALASVFFGIMFGEIFGHFGVYAMAKSEPLRNLGHLLGLHTEGLADAADPWHAHVHPWMGRTAKYLPKYLALSILVGLFHMSLSLGIGIYSAVSHYGEAQAHGDDEHADHAAKHALEKFGMLLCLWGFFFIAIGGIVPPLHYLTKGTGFPAMPAGAFMVFAGMTLITYALEGWQKVTGPIEGVSVLANAISYSRLMAVGVAGVVLAGMANDLGRQGFAEGAGVFTMVACVVGAVLGHVACLLIAIVDPLIQALRLHYVEFFSKFYETGGVPYAPLARKGGSS